MRKFIVLLALAAVSTAGQAVQVVLGPSSVVGASGSFDARFLPDNIVDQQSSAITDVSGSTYWLNLTNSGATQVYITLDLGAAYRIDELVLFNTHNDTWFDRGTGAFSVLGANAVVDMGAGNFKVTGPAVTLVSGALAASTTTVPVGQTFAVSDTGAYRYISFQPTGVASLNAAAGPTAYGLNEFRVYATAVPEPAPIAMLLAGLLVVGLKVRRGSAGG